MDATTIETRLVRLPEVMQRTGMSRSWIYDAVKGGRFPSPVRLGGRSVAWREADLTLWLRGLRPTTSSADTSPASEPPRA